MSLQSNGAAAQWAESRGDLQEALRCVRHAQGFDPGDTKTALLLTDLALQRGDPNEAIAALQTVLAIHPDCHYERYSLASVLHAAGRLTEARQELSNVLGAPDLDPETQAKARQLAAQMGLPGN